MKYKVEILPAAWEDLKTIEDWYVINFDVRTRIQDSHKWKACINL